MSAETRTMWQLRCDTDGCWQGYPTQPTEMLWGGAPALRKDAEGEGWYFDLDRGDHCPTHAPSPETEPGEGE